jgi:hypothetical protein
MNLDGLRRKWSSLIGRNYPNIYVVRENKIIKSHCQFETGILG